MVNSVTLHLIRHEYTQANIDRKYIGWTDEPIITKPQAINMKTPSKIYGSDLIRCKQTANGYFPKAPYEGYNDFRELHFGDFEMKTYEQLKQISLYRQWIDQPEVVNIPNGESFTQFKLRVNRQMKEIVQQPGEYLFIVHGGVIRLLLAQYLTGNQSFQLTQAAHRTCYTLKWAEFTKWLEDERCEQLLEAPITVKENM